MRGILRLIEELLSGNPFAVYVLIFAVVGTAIIYIIAEIVQKKRREEKKKALQNGEKTNHA